MKVQANKKVVRNEHEEKIARMEAVLVLQREKMQHSYDKQKYCNASDIIDYEAPYDLQDADSNNSSFGKWVA